MTTPGRFSKVYWTVVVVMIAMTTLTDGQDSCEYPAEIQGKSYLTFKTAVGATFSYNIIEYSTDTAELILKLSNFETPFSTVTCEDSIVSGDTMYYRRSVGDDIVCSQMIVVAGGSALLYKDFETTVMWSAEQCEEEFLKEVDEPSSWYIPFPYKETATACGLPDGNYPLTYDLGDGSQCEGDATSIANVAGDTITLSSCYGGTVTYNKPLLKTLKCVGSVEAETLLPGSGGNGDVLLLADYSTFPANVFYYCTRYEVIQDTIFLSLGVSDPDSTRCYADQTSKSAESAKYVALRLGDAIVTTVAPTEDTTEPELTTAVDETEAPKVDTTAAAVTDETNTAACDPNNPDDCDDDGEECRSIASGDFKCLKGCLPNPCQNNGTCTTTDAGFECDCVGNWKGDTCVEEDEDEDDDDDNDEIIILVVLLLVLAAVIIAVTAVAVAICQRKRRTEEEEAKDYQSMHSEGSAPADRDLANNKAWYPTYSNSSVNNGYNY